MTCTIGCRIAVGCVVGIPRKQKPSPAEGEFLLQLDPEPLEECVTASSADAQSMQNAVRAH
jgi:hypothetical protein